jgi:hypothetical protein
MLKVGATVQFPPISLIEETSVAALIVARAVGLVVHVPVFATTVTTGAVVYPRPPETIVATVPLAFEVAVAV